MTIDIITMAIVYYINFTEEFVILIFEVRERNTNNLYVILFELRKMSLDLNNYVCYYFIVTRNTV